MTKESYVSSEIYSLMKQKDFDGWERAILCGEDGDMRNWGYTESQTFPSLSVAMKWLREVHNRYIEVCTDRAHNFKDIVFRPAIYDKELDCLWESDNFSTYEQACEAAIKHCLEHLN